MATCDKDGRILLALSDRMMCLSMSMHESVSEFGRNLDALLAEHPDGFPWGADE